MDKPQLHDLRLAYDKENDIAYISIGEPTQFVGETFENGVVIKKDPETGRVVGLILLDVSRNFASTHPRSVVPGLTAELVAA